MRNQLVDRISAGLMSGFEIWMAYGIVEYVVGTIGPLLLRKHDSILAQQWRGTFYLLAGYAIIGLLGGAIVALVEHCFDYPHRRSRKLLVLTVVLAYGGNLFTVPTTGAAIGSLLACGFIACVVIRDFRRQPDKVIGVSYS